MIPSYRLKSPEEYVQEYRRARQTRDNAAIKLRGGPLKDPVIDASHVMVHFYTDAFKLVRQTEPGIRKVFRLKSGTLDLITVRDAWDLEEVAVWDPDKRKFLTGRHCVIPRDVNRMSPLIPLPLSLQEEADPASVFRPRPLVRDPEGWVSVMEPPVSAEVAQRRRVRKAYVLVVTLCRGYLLPLLLFCWVVFWVASPALAWIMLQYRSSRLND